MSHHKKYPQHSRFRYSALARYMAWANITIQVLFPLAISVTPAMTAHAQVVPQLSSGIENTASGGSRQQTMALLASNAGNFLSSKPDSEGTGNFIADMATAKANQEIQQWLNKYGTARVKLNVDKDFSLKDSSLEMLYPFYDTPTDMLFTQGAIHRTDHRTQSNIGFGWRHFSANGWMAGVNTFIDHDISRSHTRFGIGAEYWRDYLKLSANAYLRASGWKNAPDVEDYQERPANGWDLRAEGYLPAYPQLGASLMYEQYYGDDVGLFGKDERQRDPHAISAGINYTPIPLLTLNAEQKQGMGGKNETRFGLEVNYRFGEPLSQQLDPDNVRERRVLSGNRYDLVERNNNIVLEYRKAEVIRIALPQRIEGKGGQTVSSGLVVSKANHGLKNVQWEAPSLLAAGGKITGQGSQWEITLPDFNPAIDNRYTISAVAYDTKGNASKRVQTEVVVTTGADEVSLENSQISAGVVTLKTGESTTLTLVVKDKYGHALSGLSLSETLTGSAAEGSTVSEWVEQGEGIYTATLTVGRKAGDLRVMPQFNGQPAAAEALKLTVLASDQASTASTLTVKDSVLSVDTSTMLTLSARDGFGNPITDIDPGRFSATLSGDAAYGSTVANWASNGSGDYTAVIHSGTKAGTLKIMPQIDGKDAVQHPAALDVIGNASQADISNVEVKVDDQVADGQSASVVTLTVKDDFGNPVQNQKVMLKLPEGMTNKEGNSLITDADGKVTLELISTKAGKHTFTVVVNGNEQNVTLTFKPDASSSQAYLKVDNPGDKVANGTDAFTLTANVADKQGNPVPDAQVMFNLPKGVKMPSGESNHAYTDKLGNAVLHVVSVNAGTFEITASVGNRQTSEPQAITFVADKTTATIANIEVVNNSAIADGKTKQVYKVTVTDANNNRLQDSEVTMSASPELTLNPAKATTNAQGLAEFTATTLAAGTYQLTATVTRPGGGTSTKTVDAKFVADAKNAVLTVTPQRVDNLVADGTTTTELQLSLMAGINPVGGTFEIEVNAPKDVAESDYTITPNKFEHFISGKRTIKFSTKKPGEYQLTISALTYAGYDVVKPVTVTINAVEPENNGSGKGVK